MTGREAFKIWAPSGARWVDWVRPVPFVPSGGTDTQNPAQCGEIPGIAYLDGPQGNTAIIVDMPGPDSVMEGIALARMGFRPIPLFNGTVEQACARALVDNHAIGKALKWGAAALEKITIPPNAPPAFLLDSNRTHRYKMDVLVFDNSWDIYDQDMPSAGYFLQHGITRMVVRGGEIQKDLVKILYKFQKKGIAILFTDGYTLPGEAAVKRPRRQK